MKKTVYVLILSFLMLISGGVCYAQEALGNAVYTDVITYINHVPIASHNFNGRTLIAAEDLRDFGFDVEWNERDRTLTINRNENNDINMPFVQEVPRSRIGKKEFVVTTTDVEVFTQDFQYSAFGGIDGYTLIDVNELMCIDNVSVVWCPEVRAVKIWIEDGLCMYNKMVRVWPANEPVLYAHCTKDKMNLSVQIVSSDEGCVIYAQTATRWGELVCCENDRIDVVDVLDADGNSIYRRYNPNISYFDMEAYRLGYTDYLFPRVTLFTNMDIIPTNATNAGGTVVIRYRSCKGDSFQSIEVDRLPISAAE